MVKTSRSPSTKISKRKTKRTPSQEENNLKDTIIGGMQEKKGMDIVCIDLRSLKNAVTDFFIVCHADSRTHVESIAAEVEDFVYKHTGESPYHKEGIQNAEWVLLDYVSTVAHIFLHEQREFYGIERLWADAAIQQIANNY